MLLHWAGKSSCICPRGCGADSLLPVRGRVERVVGPIQDRQQFVKHPPLQQKRFSFLVCPAYSQSGASFSEEFVQSAGVASSDAASPAD